MPSIKNISGFAGFLFTGGISKLNPDTTYIDKRDCEKPFKDHYDKFILPYVKEFESSRIEALNTFRSRSIKSIPIFAIACCIGISAQLYWYLGEAGFKLIGFLLLTLGALLSGWAFAPIAMYKNSVKSKIFPNVFSFFGNDFLYNQNCPISISTLSKSQIIPEHHKCSSEDYVIGKYEDVSIKLFEAHLTKEYRTKNGTRTVSIFKGLFISLSMNKNFKGQTIVTNDRGAITNFFSDSKAGMDKVKLEDSKFESYFDAFATDQVEGRYLLTTSFMERLLKLKEYTRGSAIECSFYDNILLLKIPSNHNRFELSSMFEPATFIEDIQIILSEMDEIFKIIDILKLNEKTGL